jgi:hypothetical protein
MNRHPSQIAAINGWDGAATTDATRWFEERRTDVVAWDEGATPSTDCSMQILDVETVPSAWPTETKNAVHSGAKGVEARPCCCDCHMQNGCQGSTLSCALRKLFPSRLGLLSKTPTLVAASVRGWVPELCTRLLRESIHADDEADKSATSEIGAEEGVASIAQEREIDREQAIEVAGSENKAAGSVMRANAVYCKIDGISLTAGLHRIPAFTAPARRKGR